jgi:hypothetical protein
VIDSRNDFPFALFVGFTYYSAPGWQGYNGSFETVELASEAGKNECDEYGCDWWH